jgi:hypothetical protein
VRRGRPAQREEDASGDDQRRPDDQVADAQPPERDHSGEAEERDADDPARPRRGGAAVLREGDPGGGIREHARAARERQEGEDEPDERRVDARGAPEPGTDAGQHALARAAGEARQGGGQPRRDRAHRLWTSRSPKPTFASSSSVGADAVAAEACSWCTFQPSSFRPKTSLPPAWTWLSTTTCALRGT